MSIERRVFWVAVEQLGADEDEVNRETDIFADLGADESDMKDFIGAIEAEFEVELPAEVLGEVETLGDIIGLISSM